MQKFKASTILGGVEIVYCFIMRQGSIFLIVRGVQYVKSESTRLSGADALEGDLIYMQGLLMVCGS
ncbi:MAG: hypothetical protein ACLU4N_27390 [Butyricimonas faecihominis]